MSLSEKLRSEAAAMSSLTVERSTSGLPNHVRLVQDGIAVWSGHRDLIPAHQRPVRDPHGILAQPASD